jgi:MFS family permease
MKETSLVGGTAEPVRATSLQDDSTTPGVLHRPWYRYYVLGVLLLAYIVNVMDRGVLSILLESIKKEFGASDMALGLLGGLSFAVFYATLGIPIAMWADRWSRRNVLAIAVATWSAMTALCGMAVNFTTLVLARIGTAAGEAGGSPPSHSLIADYFEKHKRATALSVLALGVPIGTMAGNLIGGWSHDVFGWRQTFLLVGLPGLLVALLVRLTVVEPPRGFSERAVARSSPDGAPGSAHANVGQPLQEGARSTAPSSAAPPISEVLRFLASRKAFCHMCLAAALHSIPWYSGSIFNAAFFIRSHEMSASRAGFWLAVFAAAAALGTFTGGFLSDRLSKRLDDWRWYMWVPGIATLAMVPLQFTSYLGSDLTTVMTSFCIMYVLAAMFFGPSFAVTQAIATPRVRATAASILIFIQTLIGLGVGPFLVGAMSEYLKPEFGTASLRYALVIIGLTNIWAAAHYLWGARTLRADIEGSRS